MRVQLAMESLSRFAGIRSDGSVALTRGQFDALILGLPWERLADGGVIRVL